MTAPRWIVEAIDAAYDNGPGDGKLATALIERLPLEAMAKAGLEMLAAASGKAQNTETVALGMASAMIGILADGDPEVVELTELYQTASKVLDDAGVPHAARLQCTWCKPPGSGVDTCEQGGKCMHCGGSGKDEDETQLDLAARIRWLALQRPTRLELQRVEAERDEANRLLGLARAAVAAEVARSGEMAAERDRLAIECEAALHRGSGYVRRIADLEHEVAAARSEAHTVGEFLRAAHEELTIAGVPQSPTDSQHMLDSALARRIRALRDERNHLRSMYENASDDLNRERSAHQEARAAASNREIALTANLESANERERIRDVAILALIEGDSPAGDLRHALAELIGMGPGSANARYVRAATDRQVLRAKVADQAAYIEQLEVEIAALEDGIWEDEP